MIRTYTLVAAILSLVLLALFYWWFQPDLMVLLAYLGLAVAAALSVPALYRLVGYSDQDDITRLQQREATEHTALLQRLADLRSELGELKLEEGVRQADALSGILDDYHSVVETRFFGKKSAPLSYLGAARTVQKQAVQNLADVVATGHSLSGIAHNFSTATGQQRQERHGELYEEQSRRLRGLLDENNRLFDALTATAVEVANMKSVSEFERTDAHARLLTLAQIANGQGH
ncbi:MAG TPA: hypothetical protein PLB10_11740 [Thiolinea sp.]|nr:hypothetical protein [Thiolinea sp.]